MAAQGAATFVEPRGFVSSAHLDRRGGKGQRRGMTVSAAAVHFTNEEGLVSSPAEVMLFHGGSPIMVKGAKDRTPRFARLPYAEAAAALQLRVAEGDVDSADFAVLGEFRKPDTPPSSAATAVIAVDVATGASALTAEAALAALNDNEALRTAAQLSADAAFQVTHPRTTLFLPKRAATPEDLSNFATARGLLVWHAANRFCGRDGSRTAPEAGGAKRVSTASGASLYPRVDPVAIMAIQHPSEPSVLLGRQAGFPTGMYSALAGFVEAGETLEAAVVRETQEEAGVTVDPSTVRYVASQPWPLGRTGTFSQLMLGCTGVASSPDLHVATAELEHAAWVPLQRVADLVRASLSGAPPKAKAPEGGEAPPLPPQGTPPDHMFVPGPYAVAHTILRAWVESHGVQIAPDTPAESRL